MTTSVTALTVKYLREMKSKEHFKVFRIIRKGAHGDILVPFFPSEDLFAVNVNSFKNGKVKLFIPGSKDLDQVIDIALGLMANGSNFVKELKKAFSLKKVDEIKSISFKFKGEVVHVNSVDEKETVLRRALAPIFKKQYRVNKVFSKVMEAKKEPSFVNPVVKYLWYNTNVIFECPEVQKRFAEHFIGYIQYVFENRKAVNFEKLYKSIVECLSIVNENSSYFYISRRKFEDILDTFCSVYWYYNDKFRGGISNDDRMLAF